MYSYLGLCWDCIFFTLYAVGVHLHSSYQLVDCTLTNFLKNNFLCTIIINCALTQTIQSFVWLYHFMNGNMRYFLWSAARKFAFALWKAARQTHYYIVMFWKQFFRRNASPVLIVYTILRVQKLGTLCTFHTFLRTKTQALYLNEHSILITTLLLDFFKFFLGKNGNGWLTDIKKIFDSPFALSIALSTFHYFHFTQKTYMFNREEYSFFKINLIYLMEEC